MADVEQLHLIRRVDHAVIESSLEDEAIARMLVGRLGAHCLINGWPWKWRSTADVVAFLPEDHRAHPRYEETVAELCWTCPSWPGSDWPDAGEVSLDRLGSLYWWTRLADQSPLETDVYLGRFGMLDDARIELWDLLDRRGYRLDWDGRPGPHSGGLMALLSPWRREVRNNDSWKWETSERASACNGKAEKGSVTLHR
jgi:hypothetical protein